MDLLSVSLSYIKLIKYIVSVEIVLHYDSTRKIKKLFPKAISKIILHWTNNFNSWKTEMVFFG